MGHSLIDYADQIVKSVRSDTVYDEFLPNAGRTDRGRTRQVAVVKTLLVPLHPRYTPRKNYGPSLAPQIAAWDNG